MRIVAVILSLVSPGAGHALKGRWRAGHAWGLGLPLCELAWILTAMRVTPFDRDHSLDSGAWGFVQRDKILGRVAMIDWW